MNLTYDFWLAKRLDESLIELNEAFDEKDHKRIEDIVTRAKGDKDKEISLATTMANKIEDAAKSKRRADAADDMGLDYLSRIFTKRATELEGGITDETENDATEDTEEKPEASVKVKKERGPVVRKYKPGEYVKVSGDMIIKGKVGTHANSGGWIWIKAVADGARKLEVNNPQRGRSGGRFSNYIAPQSASSNINSSYLQKLGDDAIFYVVIKKVGAQWIEGSVVFCNGIENSFAPIRVKIKDLVPPGPELEIFKKHLDDLNSLRNVQKFVLGDEDFIMDEDGKTLDDVTSNTYTLLTLNFELTRKLNEPVVYCGHKGKSTTNFTEMICAPLAKMKELKDSITNEQCEVVADFLSKQLGSEKIKYDERYQQFDVTYYKVVSDKQKGFLAGYQATPFFSKKTAEDHIEELKKKSEKEKLPYAVDNLEVKYNGSFTLSYLQLMDYSKLAGIEVKMRKFFEDKRGAISTKKFGF